MRPLMRGLEADPAPERIGDGWPDIVGRPRLAVRADGKEIVAQSVRRHHVLELSLNPENAGALVEDWRGMQRPPGPLQVLYKGVQYTCASVQKADRSRDISMATVRGTIDVRGVTRESGRFGHSCHRRAADPD